MRWLSGLRNYVRRSKLADNDSYARPHVTFSPMMRELVPPTDNPVALKRRRLKRQPDTLV